MHPLIVHLTVVGIPVVALLVMYAALRPGWHVKHPWLVSIATLLATISAAITNSTGEELLVLKGASEHDPGIYGDHANKAKIVMISAAVMLVLMLVYHFLQVKKQIPALAIAVRGLAVLAAIAAIVGVVLAGHAGALLVWTQ